MITMHAWLLIISNYISGFVQILRLPLQKSKLIYNELKFCYAIKAAKVCSYLSTVLTDSFSIRVLNVDVRS